MRRTPAGLQFGERFLRFRRGSGPASRPSRCIGRRARQKSGSSPRSRSGPRTFQKSSRHAVVLEPLRAADQNGCAVDVRLHAATGGFGKILRLGQRHAGFARELRERLGGRMVAVFFGGGGERSNSAGLRFADRRQAADGELAGRQRAGFVEDKGVDFRGGFDVARRS